MESSTEQGANLTRNQTRNFLNDCSDQRNVLHSIYGIAALVMAMFGIVGQITAVIVLVQPSMRSSTSILLVVMAVYDILLLSLMLSTAVRGITTTINNIKSKMFSVGLHKFFSCFLRTVHTGTIYMTVLVTIERAVVVVFPLQAKRVCTMTRAGIASLVVLVWAVIYSIPIYMAVGYETDNSNQTEYNNQLHNFVNSHFYKVVYHVYISSVFHLILPVGVIIILNIAIIQRLYTSGRSTIRQVSSSGDNQIQLTIMIIVVTVIFCACRLLYTLSLALYPKEQTDQNKEMKHSLICISCQSELINVAEIVIIVSSSSNFIVYSIFGRKFRSCLRDLCCSTRCSQAPKIS